MKDSPKQKELHTQGTISPETIQDHVVLTLVALATAAMTVSGGGLEHYAGGFLINLLLMYIVYRDILRYKPQYLRKRRMMLLLALLIVFTIGTSRFVDLGLEGIVLGYGTDVGGTEAYGVPVAAGAMLIMVLFDFHAAIVASAVISMLAGLWQGDPAFTVYAFVGSLTAAFTIIGCRKRTAILRSGLYVLGANMVAVFTVLLFKGVLFTASAPWAFAFAAFSALMVLAIVSLTLPALESIFKVTTDISLLELLDLEHPLMKNLMIEAPGTYHHSIIVGNLVEACAESVGVNPLLARVGAYYHDIGKAKMPEYFIENQSMGASKHEKLTPHMSSMVLVSHVKEGVDMATKHKLPEDLIDLIQQHHGNTLITYFYEKAKKEHMDGEELSEEVYRYPGPRPQTRTAALIMMADAVEAASRVLNDPTPARVSALVDRIINHIFLAGQLEECELTLKDISNIKERFTFILNGVLHKRVEYPGFDFNGKGGAPDAGEDKQSSEQEAAGPFEDREGLPRSPQAAKR